VSTKLKEIREKLKDIDMQVSKGELVLRETKQQTALALPSKNPFYELKTFEEMAGITNAGGAIFGSAAHAVSEGFTNEELPYEERMTKVMKGAAVIGGGLLSLYATFKQLSEEGQPPQKPPIRVVVSSGGQEVVETTTNGPAPSTPTAGQG
jgi:hypothetical protein